MAHNDIRIGTLAQFKTGAGYVRQILPHGFESFQYTSWQELPDGLDLDRLAKETLDVIGDRAVISSLSCYGNVLMNEKTRRGVEQCIESVLELSFFGAVESQTAGENRRFDRRAAGVGQVFEDAAFDVVVHRRIVRTSFQKPVSKGSGGSRWKRMAMIL